ncbi:acyl carrier protein [Pelagibius sp. Alg239-R121]|uniref:acyl carrier protein n=1 Tax=Pelagibius sp. Alg239-R121 TaxID=2993448 RepID=UPI0024A62174|nr:phosphopantetheine-binding protein [Pelagibius sp. Alg239-R121]
MLLTRDQAQEKLQSYLADKSGIDVAELGIDAPLFSSETLDSLEAVNLISFLDTDLGAQIDAFSISFEELDTINKILDLSGF